MFLLELLRRKKPSRIQLSLSCGPTPTRPDTGLPPGWLLLVPSRQGTSLNPQGLAPNVTQRRFQIRWVSDGEERRSHRSEEWGGEDGPGKVKDSCFSLTSGAPRLSLICLLLLSRTFTSGAEERGGESERWQRSLLGGQKPDRWLQAAVGEAARREPPTGSWLALGTPAPDRSRPACALSRAAGGR